MRHRIPAVLLAPAGLVLAVLAMTVLAPSPSSAIDVAPPVPDPQANAAAWEAAHDSLPAEGGEIRCAGRYRIDRAITIAKPVVVRGDGSCIIELASPVQDGFVIPTEAAVVFEDLTIASGSGIQSSGAALRWTTGASRGWRVNRVRLIDQFVGILAQGWAWTIRDVWVTAQFAGVLVQNNWVADAGDNTIESSMFLGPQSSSVPATYGLIWQSGGGLRLVNNKFNTWASGTMVSPVVIELRMLTGPTGNFLIAMNSIEGFSGSGILVIDPIGNGQEIVNMQILGNQIAGGIGGAAGINWAPATRANHAIISNNLIRSVQTGIVLQGGDDFLLSGNLTWDVGTALVVAPGVTVTLGTNRF